MPPQNVAQRDSSTEDLYLGVDVGGTNVKLGLVTPDGRPVVSTKIATEAERGPADAARRIGDAARVLLSQGGVSVERLARVGLATPGPMDIPAGMILCPGNLPTWHNEPIRDLVADACGRPVTYANDANAAAYGEFWSGAGRQYRSLVLFTMGTGIGGGIVTEGALVEGLHSCGGELGHVIIDSADDAPLNSLGTRGTLEGYCGAYALVRRAKEALAGCTGPLADRLAAEGDLTPLDIAETAEAGDSIAMELILQTAKYMALGAVTAIHSIDPEIVAIGGAMTFGGAGHPLGERFLSRLREETDRRLIPSIRGKIRIEFATLGSDAGYIGAAGLAAREYAISS
jgi:glucokinase